MGNLSQYGGGYAYQKLRSLGCSESTARIYAAKTSIKSFGAGELVWTKGQNITHWCTIINGLVSCSLVTPNKEDVHVALFGENSWFGEHSILSQKPSFANYSCLVPVDILQIASSSVHELLETEIAFASKLAKISAWRVQRTSEMLMLMRLGNPALRSVIGISQFAETLAYNADRPPTIGFGSEITIPINQTVLASLCGVSRSRLSAVIHALEKHGWLRLEYGRIEVLNLPAWHAFASTRRNMNDTKYDPTIEDLIESLYHSAPH
ncbi:hypothetical protein AEP_01692 [Curvibacter sp. AEP1-3]|uniref:Crp/Fnr family transcriptional regulator n=1 Tax=Curvibacter sp. AEP1-3 TaxID=1844971 RepID=UPI000B3C2048|nr:Crp/Fnr family transcriptional regulator [Curvibacter sp. AEP1-3]ARV18636.1 hypothetical protein AEP_01692 [Curvibacter sp. AEP1-3]